jgi:transposase
MIPHGTKVYFATQPADLRKSFDGLATLARSVMEREPAEGGLFVFRSRRGDQIRVLFRDPQGWCLLSKRLDHGRFRRPKCDNGRFVWESEASELMRFLDDIDLTRAVKRIRRELTPYLSLVRTPTTTVMASPP